MLRQQPLLLRLVKSQSSCTGLRAFHRGRLSIQDFAGSGSSAQGDPRSLLLVPQLPLQGGKKLSLGDRQLFKITQQTSSPIKPRRKLFPCSGHFYCQHRTKAQLEFLRVRAGCGQQPHLPRGEQLPAAQPSGAQRPTRASGAMPAYNRGPGTLLTCTELQGLTRKRCK